ASTPLLRRAVPWPDSVPLAGSGPRAARVRLAGSGPRPSGRIVIQLAPERQGHFPADHFPLQSAGFAACSVWNGGTEGRARSGVAAVPHGTVLPGKPDFPAARRVV